MRGGYRANVPFEVPTAIALACAANNKTAPVLPAAAPGILGTSSAGGHGPP